MFDYKNNLRDCIRKNKNDNLYLEVVSSATLQKGQIIEINPLGLCDPSQSQR